MPSLTVRILSALTFCVSVGPQVQLKPDITGPAQAGHYRITGPAEAGRYGSHGAG